MLKNNTNTWLTLLTFVFLLAVVFIIFTLASRTLEPIVTQRDGMSSLTEPTITIIDPARGATEPSVIIVEFGDYACSACKSLDIALSQLLLRYPNEVRVVWKDAPNESLHPESLSASVAGRCADKQDQFWTYHDELFLRGELNKDVYLAIAEDLELDKDEFIQCLDDENPLPRIQKTLEEVEALNMTATPTIFIGEERWVGALSLEELQTIVEDRLK